MAEPILIHHTEVLPGTQHFLRIPVGRLPSGNQILVNTHVFRAVDPGPSVLLLAGVHGDEINSVDIVRRVIAEGVLKDLQCGMVIVIPVLNIFGLINFSRDLPDGKDVNRSFPGRSSGSLASRVARVLTRRILPHVDFGVDFHTGGHHHYNYPQIRYSAGHAQSKALAEQFAPPFILASKPIAKSLRKVALDAGKPIIVFEGGENLRLDHRAQEAGLQGVRRLLQAHAMLPAAPVASEPVWLEKSSWVRAGEAGLFRYLKGSGEAVEKGEIIGNIHNLYGEEYRQVAASRTGYLIGHNKSPIVSSGDALFHIGY